MTYKDGMWGEKAKLRSKNRNEYFRNYQRRTNGSIRKKVIEKFKSRCKRCGFDDVRILQIDHVNNDGNIERRTKISSRGFYYKVLRDTDNNYQLLCPNCNWLKRFERAEMR